MPSEFFSNEDDSVLTNEIGKMYVITGMFIMFGMIVAVLPIILDALK